MLRGLQELPVVFLSLFLGFCLPARGSELKPATAEAFAHYAQVTEARIHGEVADPGRFLYFDSLPQAQKEALVERLRGGYVLVQRMHTRQNGHEIEVPDGLVHHWLAIGFIPGVTLRQALDLAQDFPRHPQVYGPDIQRAKVIDHSGQHYTVDFRFYHQSIVTVAYDAEFKVDYFSSDSNRAYSFSRAERIAEVDNPGKPDERELPAGEDDGYMWRLNLYTRYLEKDNGVYFQIEFLALSRSVPLIFAWLVNPFIRSIPRDYLTHYVLATRKALGAAQRAP